LIRKLLLLLQGAVVLAALLIGWALWSQQQALQQTLNLEQERLLEVPAGSSPSLMLNRLEQEGVLSGALWLRLYWRFNLKQSLHSGEYRLQPGMRALSRSACWKCRQVPRPV